MTLRSVTIWVNAFIPIDVSGATMTVRVGPHAGKTALDGGTTLLLTDQRAFSNDRRALSRMHSHIRIELGGAEPTVMVSHRCDWTIACDRRTGEVVCRNRASTRQMASSVASIDPAVVRLECMARHPCPDAPPPLEQLEYRGTLTYRPAIRELSVDLMVGLFPAFEGYAVINGGPPTILFRQAPPPGIIASYAARGAYRRIRTSLTIATDSSETLSL